MYLRWWLLPELESLRNWGNGTPSPMCPSACIAIEASVEVSLLTISTKHESALWSRDSEICKKNWHKTGQVQKFNDKTEVKVITEVK